VTPPSEIYSTSTETLGCSIHSRSVFAC